MNPRRPRRFRNQSPADAPAKPAPPVAENSLPPLTPESSPATIADLSPTLDSPPSVKSPGTRSTISEAMDLPPEADIDLPEPAANSLPAPLPTPARTRKPAPSPSQQPPTSATARYEFRGEIGRGGMGVVMRAFDRDVRREVAMKLLLAKRPGRDLLARFLEEGQIAGQLEHPNIVPVHEVGVDPAGRMYFTMKRVRGLSLADRLHELAMALRDGRGDRVFPLIERLDVFRKICDAVAFAHSRGVIHRDLKPDNVMVGEFGEVLVMDWGLAKVLGRPARRPLSRADSETVDTYRAQDNLAQTADGTVAGTPSYMPPEQAAGDVANLDERSDGYSLGAILYELLCLAPPVDGDSVNAILDAVMHGAIEPPMARARTAFGSALVVPRELQAIALKAMSRESRRRYRTATDLRHDIDAYLANQPLAAYRDGVFERLMKWGRRHPARAVAIGLSSGLAMVAGFVVALIVSISNAELAAAELRIAQAEAAREREQREAEIATARERDERERAEMRAMVAAGEIEKLRDKLGVKLGRERDTATVELVRRYREGKAAGKQDRDIFREFGEADIGRYIAAFGALIAASEQHGDGLATADDHYFLGLLYALGRDDAQSAIECYSDALRLAPTDARVFSSRGSAHLHAGHFPAALADYNRAIELNPHDARSINNRGMLHHTMRNYAAALADFDRAINLAPNRYDLFLNRGNARRESGDFAGALSDFDYATLLNPNFAEAYFNAGLLRLQRGDYAAALTALDKAIRVRPLMVEAWNERGRTYEAMGNQSAARADFDHAIELAPDSATGYLNRALLEVNAGNPSGALPDFDRAIARDDRNAVAYANRGAVRASLEDLQGALADVRRATELDPTMWQSWANLGRLYAQLRNPQAAISALQRARQECPDPKFRDHLTDMLRQLGAN